MCLSELHIAFFHSIYNILEALKKIFVLNSCFSTKSSYEFKALCTKHNADNNRNILSMIGKFLQNNKPTRTKEKRAKSF